MTPRQRKPWSKVIEESGVYPFRRLWASEPRHLPAQDVAAAGGCRSLQVMRDAYQHAGAAAMMSALESSRTAPEPEVPTNASYDTTRQELA